MACATAGAVTQLSVDGRRMQFRKVVDRSVYQLTDSGYEAITGYLDPLEERAIEGLKIFNFDLHLEPTIEDLDTLLPECGFTEAPADTFTLAETLTAFEVIMNRGPKYHTYTNTYVDKAIFRHQKGDIPLQLELKCVALDETVADADPGMPAFSAGTPYPFPQAVLTLISTSRAFDRYALSVDHKVIREFNNSQTATCVVPSAREITFACSTPYIDDTEDLYTDRVTDSDGAGATLVYTRAGQSTTFTFHNLKLLAKPPDILAKDQEVRLDQFYRAYRSTATEALIITHDATA